jgi:hypothetical protein
VAMGSACALVSGALAKTASVLLSRRRFFQLWLTIVKGAAASIHMAVESTWEHHRDYHLSASNCTNSCSLLCALPPFRFSDEATNLEVSHVRLERVYFPIVPRDIEIRRHVNETYWLNPRAQVTDSARCLNTGVTHESRQDFTVMSRLASLVR